MRPVDRRLAARPSSSDAGAWVEVDICQLRRLPPLRLARMALGLEVLRPGSILPVSGSGRLPVVGGRAAL